MPKRCCASSTVCADSRSDARRVCDPPRRSTDHRDARQIIRPLEGPDVFVEHHAPEPPPAHVLEALAETSVSTVGHLTDFGFPTGLSPLYRPLKFVGPAVTVKIPPRRSHRSPHRHRLAATRRRPRHRPVRRRYALLLRRHGQLRGTGEGSRGRSPLRTRQRRPRGHRARVPRLLPRHRGAHHTTARAGGEHQRPRLDRRLRHPARRHRLRRLRRTRGAPIRIRRGPAKLLAEKEAAEPEQKRRIDAGESLSDLSGARALFNRAADRG